MSGAGELRERVLRGGLWTGISYATSRGLAFAQTVVLARLLLPDDLGLMAAAMFAVGGLNAFTQVGVDLALIRGPSLERRDLDTGWVVSVCRGALLAAVAFGAAPLVAGAFGDGRVGPVLRVLSATFLFEGFLNVGVVAFRRDLDFRRQTIFEQVSESLTTFVTVGAALVTRNVWALVVGQVAGVFFRTVSSYVLSPFRPAFRVDREALRGLLGYGRHVTVTGILLFFFDAG